MKNKCLIVLLMLLLGGGFVFAQKMTIKGKVTDSEDNSPLLGATVRIEGMSVGVITGLDGEFTIEIPEKNVVLIFSYVGYQEKKIRISNDRFLSVPLVEDTKLLSEVVVTALGITRESKSLGYAHQTINTESLTEVRDANLTNMLAGKAAGLNVISGSGPTSSTRIEIRGSKSLTGNNQPVFVIDGVLIQNDMGQEDDLDYGNIAGNINPDDVESIEVLKGANAAALYGSDAANGAILITTKKGRAHKDFGVSYSLNMMFSTIREYPEFQNVYGGGNSMRLGESSKYRDMDQANLVMLSVYNARSWGIPMLGFDVLGRDGEVKPYSSNPNNVYDYYNTARQITNSLSVNKSNEYGSFRFSYTNTNSNDVLKNTNERDRHNFSLRTSYNLHRLVNVEANVRYSIDNVNNRSYSGWSDRNPMKAYLFFPRDISLDELTPWKDENGNALKFSTASDSEFRNPLWSINECWNEDTKKWLLTDVSLTIDMTKGLKFKVRASADVQTSSGFDFTNKGTPWQVHGQYKSFHRSIDNYQYEGFLTYDKRIHDFSVFANIGANWRQNTMKRENSLSNSLIVHDMASLSNSAEAIQVTQSEEVIKRQSIFGSISLGYRDWIYMDVTGRNDWNSTLPIENCSYFYPSVGGSFVFSEAFKLSGKILSFGKVRASWAKVGNGTSFNQLYNNYIYDGLFNSVPIFSLGNRLKNPYLKPETTYSTELGTDLRFFKSRFTIDATYYHIKSVDQIVRAKVSTSTGFAERIYNAGEIQNKGVELSVFGIPVKTKDFEWNVTLNWAKNKNKVVSIMDDVPSLVLSTWSSGLTIGIEEGEPYGVLKGTDIKYDEDGNAMIQENGRPYTEADVYLGNVQPRFTGSLATGVKFKGFDLNVMFDFKSGGKFFSASAYHGVREGSSLRSLEFRDEYLFSSTVLGEDSNERMGVNSVTNRPYTDSERVKGGIYPGVVYQQDDETGEFIKIGPNTNYISAQTYWQNASGMYGRFIYNASYIKLRELSVGYTVPRKFLKQTPIKSARLSVVGRNLCTLYSKTPKGIDPQATSSSGNDQGLEAGFALPTAYYGFDFKISF